MAPTSNYIDYRLNLNDHDADDTDTVKNLTSSIISTVLKEYHEIEQ